LPACLFLGPQPRWRSFGNTQYCDTTEGGWRGCRHPPAIFLKSATSGPCRKLSTFIAIVHHPTTESVVQWSHNSCEETCSRIRSFRFARYVYSVNVRFRIDHEEISPFGRLLPDWEWEHVVFRFAWISPLISWTLRAHFCRGLARRKGHTYTWRLGVSFLFTITNGFYEATSNPVIKEGRA